MTAPCPHCGATASKPSPVAGEPNCTESWIIHADRCPGPTRPTVVDGSPDRDRPSASFVAVAPTPDPANPLGLPYGPKPAKSGQNGATA